MGLTAKGKSRSRGMGFYLVFFPPEEDDSSPPPPPPPPPLPPPGGDKTTKGSHHKPPNPFLSSSSGKFPTILRRTNSSNIILTRLTQSTISICGLLIFIALLLFAHLSTFDPNPRPHSIKSASPDSSSHRPPEALQGLGTLYMRGTSAMNDIVISHVPEDLSPKQLRLFLRLFHRSGLLSRSDLLFIFPSPPPPAIDAAVRDENRSFLRLLLSSPNSSGSRASFDVAQMFAKSGKKETDPIWGRRSAVNNRSGGGNTTVSGDGESTRPIYGSVLGFTVGELDPENALAGFLDHVPMSLRRWACYPMLLGRVRRNFKHVMLVDAKEVLLLGDPLGRVRGRSPESIHLSAVPAPPQSKHGRRGSNQEKNHQKPVSIYPAIVMGGARGIRRLSTAVLTGIVRASTQHKQRKNPVTESGLLSQLVTSEFLLASVKVATSTEHIPEMSSLGGLDSGAPLSLVNYPIIRRGNSNNNNNNNGIDIDEIIMKHTCSFSLDSSVYTDC